MATPSQFHLETSSLNSGETSSGATLRTKLTHSDNVGTFLSDKERVCVPHLARVKKFQGANDIEVPEASICDERHSGDHFD